MPAYSIKDAQSQLHKLIADAKAGETVLITDGEQLTFQLLPVPPSPNLAPRKAGSARGQILIADDFDAPLNDFDDYMP